MSEPASSEMARQHAAQRRWRQAYEAFRELEEAERRAEEDWPNYARTAALCGHFDVYLAVFERLYQHHLDAGRALEAGNAAYWIGFGLVGTPERARAGAWFMRSQRLVDSVGQEVIEQGYLLLPVALRHFVSGQFAEAADTARRALALGERFSNWDVIGLAQNLLGRVLLRTGRVSEGLAIVIGGGQAGLSVGYHLKQLGARFLMLDASKRVGDGWRQRWDSLRLFTCARFSSLDGMRFPAPPDYFPTKDEMADYLEAYAARFELPLLSGVRVDPCLR